MWARARLFIKITPRLFISFRAYSYYNRTGGNDDDERPIDGHTAAHPTAASELCINGYVTCGRKITWGPGLRACKVPNFGEGMALLPPGIPHANDPGDELEDAVGGGEHAARE